MADKIDFTPLESDIQFEPTEEVRPQEPLLSKIKRGIPRTLARGAEAIAGLPGDIFSAISKLPEVAEKKIGIKSGIDYENLRKLLGGPLGAPTSEEIRETLKQATGGYLEPQTKGEEIGDILTQDLATLMLPVKGKVPFKRAITQALGGNMASYLTQEVGGTEGQAAAAKVGTFVALGLIGRGGIRNQMKKLYGEVEKLVPDTAVVDASKLETSLSRIEKSLEKGISTPTKNAIVKATSEIKNKIKDGNINVDELLASKRDINELMGDPALLRRSKNLYKQVSSDINKTIETYGKQNPEFLRSFREADEIYGALANSNKFLRTFQKAKDLKSPLTWILLGLHPKATTGAIAGTAGLRAISILKRSPAVRRFYLNSLKEAAKGNSKEAAKYAKRMDDIILKEEPLEIEEEF